MCPRYKQHESVEFGAEKGLKALLKLGERKAWLVVANFLVSDPPFLQLSTQVSQVMVRSQCPSHSIFTWTFMPAEGLLNSGSDLAWPALPVCESTCQSAWASAPNTPDSLKVRSCKACAGARHFLQLFPFSPLLSVQLCQVSRGDCTGEEG